MSPEYPTNFTLVDILATPFLLLLIFFVAFRIRKTYLAEKPYYKYFITGLAVKLIGAFSMCLVYLYYYRGGDTLNYFFSTRVMSELAKANLNVFLKILILGQNTAENYSAFSNFTGFPEYYRDSLSFFVVRFATPFSMFCGGSFLATSMLVTCISYSGIWKLYETFMDEFPLMSRDLAIAILFVPSVFFWGSGILKDPLTLSAIGWFVFSFYQLFIKRKFLLLHFVTLLVSSYIMLSIKPYIYYTLIPCSSIWVLFNLSKKIKSTFIRTISMPMLMIIFGFAAYLVIYQAGQNNNKYSINTIMEFGVVVQRDLKSEDYGGNSFDIGEFDATVSSMLSKAPLAINAALFRPFLWEVKNPVMFFSGLENLFILLFTLYVFFAKKGLLFLRFIFENELLLFSLSFAILFSFSVGLTTSNFGSLVRYKIPAIPFYIASLFILKSLLLDYKKDKSKFLVEGQ